MTTQGKLEINSGSEELDKKIQQWLEWDKNEKTLDAIKNLVKEKKWDVLSQRLLTRLAFGTAGLRGAMQAGFDSMNDLVIVQTAQGLCQYILQVYPEAKDRARGIVLGYDGRYNSKRFAELSACVFINENVPVYLYSEMVATPFIPFAVRQLNCLAGVMVTASHNPKQDNGYKVYWSNSAQIISPHDKNIQNSILKNLVPLATSWNTEILKSDLLRDPYEKMVNLYVKKLRESLPEKFVEYNKKNTLKFVYTAMHGVGYPYVQKGFVVAGLQPVHSVKEQQDPDPEFPTVKFPNPEEGKSCLVLSMKLAEEIGSDVILANDPDADRLACAEKNPKTGAWKVFTGNELGALLGWWSVETYKQMNPGKKLSDCYLLASTVSSKFLKSMAAIDGLNFEETLTGFKWMGNRAIELMAEGKEVLFAFEEAIGFMFSVNVLDKDGVSAATHLATMCSYLRQTENLTLTEKLEQLFNQYGYHYSINSYYLCYEPPTIEKIFERIRNFSGNDTYPATVANGKYKIKDIRDLTTGKDTAQSDGKSRLPSSKSSQMITFTLENGTVITLRTSGTEPKIKYYSEYCAKPEETDWMEVQRKLEEIVNGTVEELLQPAKNNLTPRSN